MSKRSIAFYCCSNGLGHYKRISEVAKKLTDTCNITIYCSEYQPKKIGFVDDVNYIFYKLDNLRWDKILEGKYSEVEINYFDWIMEYGPTTAYYDIVVSDNIVGLLNFRDDVILSGSFLWKDVFKSHIGQNNISSHDEVLLESYKPTLITNKYVETQSVKEYSNKIQYGFGCPQEMKVASDTKYTMLQYPSLPYLKEYNKYLDLLQDIEELGCTKDLSYIYDTRMVARPGVGTITHCVQYRIPLIALYSEKDSEEIVELAHRVEELRIGYKQNINEPFNMKNIKLLRDNTNYCYAESFEKDGYKNIAEYLKKL